MTREEMLIAYVDGELPPEALARFESEISADPALAAEVARHTSLAIRVSAAYAPVLDEAIPPQLLATASAANDTAARPAVRRLPPWAAIAASLAVGVLAGRLAWHSSAALVDEGGSLAAKGQLAKALDTRLAADPGLVKVGLTLRTADGRYCRTFESAPDKAAGLACRQDGRWIVRTLTAWTPPPATAYRQAASETPPEVLAAVDALAAPPLDAAHEKAARDRGWK